MVGRRQKIKEKHWLKLLKAVLQKTKFGPKYRLFKISIWVLFLKILFRAYNFFFGHHQGSFLISDFLAESLKTNKNQRKRSLILQHSFTQNTSLILRISTHLTLKIICSRNASKNLSHFTSFPANMFLFGVRKSICTAPFLDTQELHS